MKFGKYDFVNREKLRRAQKKAGEGADVNLIAREYLVMGGLLLDLKGERINEIEKSKEELKAETKTKKEAEDKAKKEAKEKADKEKEADEKKEEVKEETDKKDEEKDGKDKSNK